MSNIMAAIGLIQLKRFKIFQKKRKSLAEFYGEKLRENNNLQIFVNDFKNVVPHIYPIRIKKMKNRHKLIEELKKKKYSSWISLLSKS